MSITISFIAVVKQSDPDYERDKKWTTAYDFRQGVGKGRVEKIDWQKYGAYADD